MYGINGSKRYAPYVDVGGRNVFHIQQPGKFQKNIVAVATCRHLFSESCSIFHGTRQLLKNYEGKNARDTPLNDPKGAV